MCSILLYLVLEGQIDVLFDVCHEGGHAQLVHQLE
jgi:hypothetical protein